jgi:hypothetical protein
MLERRYQPPRWAETYPFICAAMIAVLNDVSGELDRIFPVSLVSVSEGKHP